MRNIFAIVFFTIYLFNIAGYALYYNYSINQADKQLVSKIDSKQFQDIDLREVKIPIDVPYYNASTTFERVNGSINISGVEYNYVKRKVSADTLYLMCLPNYLKTDLYKQKKVYAAGANQLPSGKEKEGHKKLNQGTDYLNYFSSYNLAIITSMQSHAVPYHYPCIKSGYFTPPFQPPRQLA